MYLRNKKTGEVVDWSFVGPTAIKEYEGEDVLLERERYESIEEFISDWEDVEPAEPLIKDEKIRKAVRAWAEAVGGSPVCFYEGTDYEGGGRLKISRKGCPAMFDLGRQFYDLELGTQYTITELCGEEDE